ncbi:MAG TPA: hypothetical protein VGP72_02175 [Planctomycetota bacterium]|jgi:hypothetical protein
MLRYNERLALELTRRDAALARMHASVGAAIAVSQAKLDHTANDISAFVSQKIEHTRDAVGAQIDHAQEAYSRELEQTKTTIGAAINRVESGLNPANIVRAHPWGTTLGALVGAALLAPLFKMLVVPPAPAADPVNAPSANATSSTSNGTHRSLWKPLTDALLASVPSLVAALFQRITQTAKTDHFPESPK